MATRGGITGIGNALMGISGPAAAAVAGIAAVGAALVKSTQAAIAWESVGANIAKTAGAATDVDALSQSLLSMSTEIPMAAEGLGEIAAIAGQLGVDGTENVLAFTETIAQASVAFDMLPEAAATSLAKMVNLFEGGDVTKAGNLASSINSIANSMAASEPEIMAAMSEMAGMGAQYGMTGAEAAALSGKLIALGMAGSKAGTLMNSLMTQLVDTSKWETAGNMIGMTGDAFGDLITSDIDQGLLLIAEHLASITDAAERAKEIEKLGLGIEAAKPLNKILQDWEGIGDAVALANQAYQENVSLSEEAGAKFATTASKIQIIRNDITAIAIDLGDWIINSDAFQSSLDAVHNTLGLIRENMDVVKGVAQHLWEDLNTAFSYTPGGALLGAISDELSDETSTLRELSSEISDTIWSGIKSYAGIEDAGVEAGEEYGDGVTDGVEGSNFGEMVEEELADVEAEDIGTEVAEDYTEAIAAAISRDKAGVSLALSNLLEGAVATSDYAVTNIEAIYDQYVADMEAGNERLAALGQEAEDILSFKDWKAKRQGDTWDLPWPDVSRVSVTSDLERNRTIASIRNLTEYAEDLAAYQAEVRKIQSATGPPYSSYLLGSRYSYREDALKNIEEYMPSSTDEKYLTRITGMGLGYKFGSKTYYSEAETEIELLNKVIDNYTEAVGNLDTAMYLSREVARQAGLSEVFEGLAEDAGYTAEMLDEIGKAWSKANESEWEAQRFLEWTTSLPAGLADASEEIKEALYDLYEGTDISGVSERFGGLKQGLESIFSVDEETTASIKSNIESAWDTILNALEQEYLTVEEMAAAQEAIDYLTSVDVAFDEVDIDQSQLDKLEKEIQSKIEPINPYETWDTTAHMADFWAEQSDALDKYGDLFVLDLYNLWGRVAEEGKLGWERAWEILLDPDSTEQQINEAIDQLDLSEAEVLIAEKYRDLFAGDIIKSGFSDVETFFEETMDSIGKTASEALANGFVTETEAESLLEIVDAINSIKDYVSPEEWAGLGDELGTEVAEQFIAALNLAVSTGDWSTFEETMYSLGLIGAGDLIEGFEHGILDLPEILSALEVETGGFSMSDLLAMNPDELSEYVDDYKKFGKSVVLPAVIEDLTNIQTARDEGWSQVYMEEREAWVSIEELEREGIENLMSLYETYGPDLFDTKAKLLEAFSLLPEDTAYTRENMDWLIDKILGITDAYTNLADALDSTKGACEDCSECMSEFGLMQEENADILLNRAYIGASGAEYEAFIAEEEARGAFRPDVHQLGWTQETYDATHPEPIKIGMVADTTEIDAQLEELQTTAEEPASKLVEAITDSAMAAVQELHAAASEPAYKVVNIIESYQGASTGGSTITSAESALDRFFGLQSGGIVTSPGVYALAENSRPEAVLPLDNLKNVLSGAGKTEININSPIYIEGGSVNNGELEAILKVRNEELTDKIKQEIVRAKLSGYA